MPYDPDNPPAKVRKLSTKKQRQWVNSFNSAWEKYGDEARAHKIAWGSVKKDSEVVEDLLRLSKSLICKEEEAVEEMAEQIQSDAESAAGVGDTAPEEEKIPIETPEGAKAMALALSRIFGGWRGGCRLSPSANRADAHHLTVFCADSKEMGDRLIHLKDHLTSQGYKEIAEGVFRNGNKSVYQGRSYTRRGGRPLAFMVTVEIR